MNGALRKQEREDTAREQVGSRYSSIPRRPTSFFLQSPQKTPIVAFTSCTPQSTSSRQEAATSSEKSVTFQQTTPGGSTHKLHSVRLSK